MDLVAGDDFPTEGIQIATSGGDRQSFNWSLIDAPSWLTIESVNDGTAVLKQVSGQPITETEGLTVTVSVSDDEGRSGSDSFSIRVEPADETAPTWLTATVLPDALTGQGSPYTTSVSASDASGSVTYSVVDAEPALVSYDAQSGALQMTGWADASLDPDTGTFEGTPETVGDYIVTVRATDASGNSSDREFSLQVNDGIDPVWTTDVSLPGGTAEEPYAATVVATDETSDVSYALYGTAPGWVSVSSSGQITGTAGSAGSYSFTVRASDDNGNFVDRQFTMVIEVIDTTPPVWITGEESLPHAAVGTYYSASVVASDEGGGVTYSIEGWYLDWGEAWPDNGGTLEIDPSTGELNGIAPDRWYMTGYYVIIRATDIAGNFSDRVFDLPVDCKGPDGRPDPKACG
jgi:hypothetical protein